MAGISDVRAKNLVMTSLEVTKFDWNELQRIGAFVGPLEPLCMIFLRWDKNFDEWILKVMGWNNKLGNSKFKHGMFWYLMIFSALLCVFLCFFRPFSI